MSEAASNPKNFPVDEKGDWDWRNDPDRNPKLIRQSTSAKEFGVWSCLGWCFFGNGSTKGTKEEAEELLSDLQLLHPNIEYKVLPR